MAERYNVRHYTNIYFLIDDQGQFEAVSTSPAASLSTIEKFINGKANEQYQ